MPFASLQAFYFSMISLFFGVGLLQGIESLEKLTGGLPNHRNANSV